MALAAISLAVGWLGWGIIGGLAGMFAGPLIRCERFGILGDIAVGSIGGLIGGWLLGLFVSALAGLIATFFSAVIGACVLVWAVRSFMDMRGMTSF